MEGGHGISVVVPFYNEEDSLPELASRLSRVLASLPGPAEAIFVDDGSRDRSVEVLRAAPWAGSTRRILRLARNYGQHAAVLAGMRASSGEVIVTLDADLQNPPEEIPRLLAAIGEGHDVVGGYRAARRDPWLRRIASRLANAWIARVTGVRIRDHGCMLRAYRRDIVERMAACGETASFLPVLAHQFTDRVHEVPVMHDARKAGRSKYSPGRLLSLGFDLMTGFSIAPLRMLSFAGLGCFVASLGLGALLLVQRLLRGPHWAVEGVFTLFAALFLLAGVQFLAFGLLGEYVGRIYREVLRRPAYVVREEL